MSYNTIKYFKKFIAITVLGLFFASSLSQVFAAPLANGMDATYVLGQSNFTSNASAVSAIGIASPAGMVVDNVNNRLFVAAHDRILVYSTLDHSENGQEAIAVLGAPDFVTSPVPALDSSSLWQPRGLAFDEIGQRLFVADIGAHRVLVFDVADITDGESAVHVLGQADFVSGSPNRGNGISSSANSMSFPSALSYDATQDILYVADGMTTGGNNRVLVFDVADITNGESAVHVLGQADFVSNTLGCSANLLTGLTGISLDVEGQLLYVSANTRTLVFDVADITDGESAVYVLGESLMTSCTQNGGQNGMTFAESVSFDSETGYLYVFDTYQPRVMVFDVSEGITDGMDASFVLGQPDFDTSGYNWGGALVDDGRGNFVAGPGRTGFATSQYRSSVFVNESTDTLYVSDNGNSRVLIFDLSEPIIIPSLSHSNSFTESLANDGSLDGSIIATLTNDVFMNVGSTLTLNTHYTLTNAPAGLTPVMSVNMAGNQATLTFTGNATNHENINDVTNLTITFLNGAFTTTATASDVTNYEYTTGSIDFNDAAEEQPTPTRRSSGSSTSQSRVLAQEVFADHYANKGETTTETPSLCPSDLIITEKIKAPARNGVFHPYTGGIVSQIHILQTRLNSLGFNSGPVDGIAGPITDTAIRSMQTSLGVAADGYVGPLTLAVLNQSCGSQGLQTN